MKIVLCYSGGLDSTVLLYKLRDQGAEVVPLAFRYGQRHSREVASAFTIAERLKLSFHSADLGSLQFGGAIVSDQRRTGEGSERRMRAAAEELVGSPTVVPGRNLVFLSAALAFALGQGVCDVAIAAHLGDREIYPDCREEFFEAFEDFARMIYEPAFRLQRPFIDMTKAEIVALGRKLRVPFSETWSCYVGETMPCGKCGACLERAKALGTHENQGMTFARRKAADA